MSNTESDRLLRHAGYTGSIEVSLEDECLHGRVLHVRDLITYGGDTVAELREGFVAAVDDYLAHCQAIGKQPDKPYTGCINVRLGGDRHRLLIEASAARSTPINTLLCEAVDRYLAPPAARNINARSFLPVGHTARITATAGAEAPRLLTWASSDDSHDPKHSTH